MKGLELNERFYFEVVKELIHTEFPMLKERYAAGLIGYGSDVLGNDDILSRDHEWGPRCHIWLTNDDYEKYASDIDKMFLEQLPLSYKGYKTRYTWSDEFRALVGVDRKEGTIHHIAITTLERHLDIQFGILKRQDEYYLTDIEWLCMPEQKLLELTRGKIFEDPTGDIAKIRKKFTYYNENVWRYKILYCWEQISDIALIPLCFKRGDEIGGKICLNKVIENIVRLSYLYNKTYYPGYIKWFGYEFSRLPKIAKEIESQIKECQSSTDIEHIMDQLESILRYLLQIHNELQVTEYAEIDIEDKMNRGLCNISVRTICNVLEKSLSQELRELEVRGGCDQWINNGDLLIWSERYTQIKKMYENNKWRSRDGVGDMII